MSQFYLLSANTEAFLRRIPVYDVEIKDNYVEFGFNEMELLDIFYPNIQENPASWQKLAATTGGVKVERKQTSVRCSPDNAPDYDIVTSRATSVRFTNIAMALKRFLESTALLFQGENLLFSFSSLEYVSLTADPEANPGLTLYHKIRGILA